MIVSACMCNATNDRFCVHKRRPYTVGPDRARCVTLSPWSPLHQKRSVKAGAPVVTVGRRQLMSVACCWTALFLVVIIGRRREMADAGAHDYLNQLLEADTIVSTSELIPVATPSPYSNAVQPPTTLGLPCCTCIPVLSSPPVLTL